jgi:hypothetical protein
MRFRVSRKGIIAIIALLILVKVLLAVVTPPGLDVYSYIHLATDSTNNAFPQSPWTRLFNGTVSAWASLPVAHPPLQDIWTSKTILFDPSLQLLVFMVKLPMLLADLAVAVVLYALGRRMFPRSTVAVYASLVWLANPFATFVNEMFAAVDVVPALAVVLGVYLLSTRKYSLSFVSLAAGIVAKMFPVFLLPAFVYSAMLGGVRRVKLLLYIILALAAFSVYVLWTLLGKNFMFLFAPTPISQSITEFILARETESFSFALGGGDFVGVATFSIVLVYLLVWEFRPANLANPLRLSLVVLLAYLAFLDLEFQYVIWVVPLLTLVNFLDRRTVLPSILVYVSAFFLGFVKGAPSLPSLTAFQNYESYSLLFMNLQNPTNWLEKSVSSIIQSPLMDIVATPLLRTLLSVLMILIAFLVVIYSPRGDAS